MTKVAIEILRKQYPERGRRSPGTVLADFALELGPGEFVCLVGPSGCGKTTLLHIVSGLDRDFQGRVHFPGGSSKPRIGYVFQNPRLLPWRTVRQNIELALAETPTNPDLIDRLLEVMGLLSVQSEFPERLSLGMSRRVAIARAFAIEPDLLLMDEPFVSLDAQTARRVQRLLVKVWAERRHTILFVTHDLREAIALADRVIFLSPAPTHILREIKVDIPREARSEVERIESFRSSLIERYPEIAATV